MLARPAVAQVKPRDDISPDKANKVRDLISRARFWPCSTACTSISFWASGSDWPHPYKDEAEKYSGQTRLSAYL
jgi:hypothetical protein